jgi:hypothetical protein
VAVIVAVVVKLVVVVWSFAGPVVNGEGVSGPDEVENVGREELVGEEFVDGEDIGRIGDVARVEDVAGTKEDAEFVVPGRGPAPPPP